MPKTAEQLRQEQIARLKAWRRTYLAEQRAKQEAELKARREAAARSRSANRQPPARTWRIGRTIMWEPPATADKERPVGYWISEQLPDGGWTAHGDYLPATAREAQLYGDGPAKVETIYSQQALGECYYGETVETTPGEPWWLVSRVRYYACERGRSGTAHQRWRRVLAGFGLVEAKLGHASLPPVAPLDPPMTADEAQSYVDRGWGDRWPPVVAVLRRLEGESAPSTSTAEPAPAPTPDPPAAPAPEPEPPPPPKPAYANPTMIATWARRQGLAGCVPERGIGSLSGAYIELPDGGRVRVVGMWNRYDLKFRLVLAPGAPLTAFPPRIRVSSPGGVYNVEFYSPGPQKQMLIGEARDYRRLRGITRRGDVIRVGASTTIVLQYV